jgi:hypothetical protein
MKMKSTLTVLLTLITGFVMAQCPPPSAALTLDFKWSTAPGTGNEIPVRTAHGTFTSAPFPSGIGGYTTTVTLRDPNNRLTINNYQTDPLITGTPPYTFCYSSTNGRLNNDPLTDALYSGYYQLGMISSNSSERVDIEYVFSTPIYLCNLEISDIDYDASCAGFCSYQDEVDVSATNGGTNVPVTITKAAAFTDVTVTGQNVVANWFPGNFGDNAANSNIGKVFLSTSTPITKIVISYSNGPADDGTSNDHHIRIGGALGAVAPNNVPVKIVDFNAVNNNGSVNANLQVANQQNIEGYQLQKSIDGRNFTDLPGQLQRATAAVNYQFSDATPANGANFYRVRVKERSGEVFYSVIKRVDLVSKLGYAIKSQGQQVKLQVNSNETSKINVSVLNASGKAVSNNNYTVSKGVNLLHLEEMDNMPSGMYFVVVTENGTRTFTGKAVK